MLSPFLVSPLKNPYPLPTPPAPQPTHSHSWSWRSLILGHRAFTGPRASPLIVLQGHHLRLEPHPDLSPSTLRLTGDVVTSPALTLSLS